MMGSMPAPTPESLAALEAAGGGDTTGTAGASVGETPPEGRNLHAELQRAADGRQQQQH